MGREAQRRAANMANRELRREMRDKRAMWPTREDGSQKTMGEMTAEEQDEQLRATCEQLKIEFSRHGVEMEFSVEREKK